LAPEWPERVKGISLDGGSLFGIDDENQLYWDGRPIEMRRPLVLTFGQKLMAAITALAVIVGGFGQGIPAISDFGCKQQLWGCSPRAEHEVPVPAVAPQLAPAPQSLTPGTKLQQR
jgi:hypothetical protein